MGRSALYLLIFLLFSISIRGDDGSRRETRIRNGTPIDITQAKFYVLIRCGNSMCGGTLVRPNKIVTAGHCVHGCRRRSFLAVPGLNSTSELRGSDAYTASAIDVHPKYDDSNPFPYDVAVVTLSRNVPLGPQVGVINYVQSAPSAGSTLNLYGYGEVDTSGRMPRRLQKGVVKVSGYRGSRMIAAATGGVNALQGDSGGPGVYSNKLAGVISAYVSTGGRILATNLVSIAHSEIQSFVKQKAP